MASWFITYERPMAPPGSIKQVITPDHGCLLKITGSVVGVDLPDRAEIGRYATPLPAAEAETLKALAVSAVDEASALKGMTVPRGTRFMTFGLGRTGEDIDSLASFPLSESFPQAIKRFDESMLALAKRMLDHPQATLRGTAICEPGTLTPQENLAVTLTLRNSGPAPIRIQNPAAAASDEKVGLQVTVDKELPPGKEDEGDMKFVRLTRGEVSHQKARESDRGGAIRSMLELAPGGEIVFSLRLQRRLYLGTGAYRAWVTYESSTENVPEQAAVEGSLKIPAGTFSVKAKR